MAFISDKSRTPISTKVKPENPPLANQDRSQHISALIYIFQYEPNLLLPRELECAIITTYKCLKEMDMLQPLNNILILLENIQKRPYIYIENQYKTFIRNPWFCKLTVLSALKFHKFTSNHEEAKKSIVQEAIKTFRPNRTESIHLLQLIAKLTHYYPILNVELDADLIAFVRIAAYSPLNNFKQQAEIISKNFIRHTKASQLKQALELDFLPLKGIATGDLECVLPTLNCTGPQIVTRIIEMFSNNIENREGGFLYRILLTTKIRDDDFDVWKDTVWPPFYKKFLAIYDDDDNDSEFFQSLLKYWIPTTVMTYKAKLYQFMRCIQDISARLKGHVLLETRKRSLLKVFEEQDVLLLENLFSREETRKLALQVVGCRIKESVLPCLAEVLLVSQSLFEQSDAWRREEAYAFGQFLMRIRDAAVIDEGYLKKLGIALMSMFRYSVSLLKTSRRHFGAQVILSFYNSFINNTNEVALLEAKLGGQLFHLFKNVSSELIERAILASSEYCPELMDLAVGTIEAPKVITNDFLMDFINESCSALSIKVSDSVKNISHFIVLTNASRGRSDDSQMLYNRICGDLMVLFEDKWPTNQNPTIIFKVGLLFDALNQINRHVADDDDFKKGFLNRICSMCFPVVASMMNREYYQPENLPKVPSGQWLSASYKIEKIVEALYNSLCEFLLQNTTTVSEENKIKLMRTLVGVIEHSSMRRPTVLSTDLLKAFLISIDKKQDNNDFINSGRKTQRLANYKVDLLNETLQKLDRVASMQTLTIRKNPETRLVLHALCTSDSGLQKPALTRTLNRLLQILSDNTSNDATTAAALHCTEILMSDNTLYGHTLKYAPGVIMENVRHFQNRNWIVRNASMQVAKALVDRFLGVLIGRNNRAKSVDVVFHLFPQLIAPFYRTIAGERLTDSAVAVMQFFVESQLKNELFATEISLVAKDGFARAFAGLIGRNSGFYGVFAARAYVSLCLDRDIPLIVERVVEFVVGNFQFIRGEHTLRNFVVLLRELYDKYSDYLADKPVPVASDAGLCRVQQSFARLTGFLRRFNKRQFDFLLVKVDTLEDASATLKRTDFNLSDFHHRLWLHNNLPFLLINTPRCHLAAALSEILTKNIPEFLQVKLLSIIVDRFTKENKLCGETGDILIALCGKALGMDGSMQHALMCYYKVILLLYESHNYCLTSLANEKYSLLIKVRQLYNLPLNPYKTLVSLLILARAKPKRQSDQTFIRSAIKYYYENSNLLDAETLSESLKYLYKTSESRPDKQRVLKLALELLINHGQCHFVTTFWAKSHGPIGAIHKLLDFHFLRSFFDSDVAAFEFVKEFYSAVTRAKPPGGPTTKETYYVEEEDGGGFVDLDSIGRAVIRFLVEFCKRNQMSEWLDSYREVAGVNNTNK